MSRPLHALAALAALVACHAAPAPAPAEPAPRPRGAVVATFAGEADPRSGRLATLPAVSVAAFAEIPVVQDGVPGSGPADTVELVTEGTRTVPGACGTADAFEGSVRLRSFYADRILTNVRVEITRLYSSGHESCRSAQPSVGASAANGLFEYPTLGVAGTAGASALGTWSFRLPDGLPFAFIGRVLADPLRPCAGKVVLGTRLSPAGANARFAASADFDGDGVPDLAVLEGTTPGTTSIYRGLGDGGFTWAASLGGGSALVAADVTGDGRPDLLVASGTNVNVYRNLGRALSTTAVAVATGGTVSALAVGDLDGDGRPDLVTVDWSGGVVRTFRNTGTGGAVGFTGVTSETVAGKPGDVAVADLNGDGRLDVVAAVEATNAAAVLLGAGDGTVGAPSSVPLPSLPYKIRTADLDGDGRADLVVQGGSAIVTLRNLGAAPYPAAPAFGAAAVVNLGANPGDLRVADLNGDGHPDVAVSLTSSDRLGVLLNDGAGGLAAPATYPAGFSTYNTAYGVALGDWNGDGRLDVAVTDNANAAVYAYLNRGDGTFPASTDLGAGYGPRRVLVGDLDRDGDLDLVTIDYTYGTASILRQAADGSFASKYVSVPTYPIDGLLADLNGDGVPDLVTVHPFSSSVSVLLGRGDGTLGTVASIGVSASPQAVAAGDLNNDGVVDLVVVSSTGKRVDLLLGRGDGTFAAGTALALPSAGNAIAIGDLDGDRIADLVVAVSGAILTYRGSGGALYAAPVSSAISTSRIALADVTGDGRPDLLALHSGSYPYGVGVSPNSGSGTFGAETVYGAIGRMPSAVAAADLDGDGDLDLVVTDNETSGTALVATLRNAGGGTFEPAVGWLTGQRPGDVAVADLDGDGRLDLAIPNASGGGSVSILRGACW